MLVGMVASASVCMKFRSCFCMFAFQGLTVYVFVCIFVFSNSLKCLLVGVGLGVGDCGIAEFNRSARRHVSCAGDASQYSPASSRSQQQQTGRSWSGTLRKYSSIGYVS